MDAVNRWAEGDLGWRAQESSWGKPPHVWKRTPEYTEYTQYIIRLQVKIVNETGGVRRLIFQVVNVIKRDNVSSSWRTLLAENKILPYSAIVSCLKKT